MTDLSGPADGWTYEEPRDRRRLDKQRERVFRFMNDGGWYTPDDISHGTGDDWASAGARMRDLRKPKFGGHTVERRSLGGGIFVYRLTPNRGEESQFAKLKRDLLQR